MRLLSERLARAAPAQTEAGAMPGDEIGRVGESVGRHGWPEGFDRVLPTLRPARTRELHREMWVRHAGWKGVFSPGRRRLAVVHEAGYGSAAIALAEDFAGVVAVVPDAVHARVVRARVEWLGIGNLTVVTRDAGQLPQASVDAVVVHGFDAPISRALVGTCLQASWRAPHAALFVAIDGGNGAARAVEIGRIRRDLKRHFPIVEQFGFDRGLVDSSELVSRSVGRARERLSARLAPWRGRGVALAARPAGGEETLFGAVRDAVETHCARIWERPVTFRCVRRLFSTPEGFTLMLAANGAPSSVVVRIAMNQRTVARFRTNFDTLGLLAGPLRHLDTPAPIVSGAIAGNAFFAETMLDGIPLREHLTKASAATAVDAAIEWIFELHRATGRARHLTDANLTALVVEPVARAFEFLGIAPSDPGCVAVQQYLRRAFAGQRLPLVLAHGDYSVDNVLMDGAGSRVTAAFDWDLAAERSLPLLDVAYLLLSANLAREGGTFAHQAARMLTGSAFSAANEEAIRRYALALGIPDALRVPLYVLTWANHLARRVQSAEPYRWPHHDAEFGRPFLEPLLARVRT